jgi:hypothetical protein
MGYFDFISEDLQAFDQWSAFEKEPFIPSWDESDSDSDHQSIKVILTAPKDLPITQGHLDVPSIGGKTQHPAGKSPGTELTTSVFSHGGLMKAPSPALFDKIQREDIRITIAGLAGHEHLHHDQPKQTDTEQDPVQSPKAVPVPDSAELSEVNCALIIRCCHKTHAFNSPSGYQLATAMWVLHAPLGINPNPYPMLRGSNIWINLQSPPGKMTPIAQNLHLTRQPRLGHWLHQTTHPIIQASLARDNATLRAPAKVFQRKRRRSGQSFKRGSMLVLAQNAVLVSLHSIVTKLYSEPCRFPPLRQSRSTY